jgi:hypothetical protein
MVTARPRRPFPQAPPKVPLSRPSASSLVSRVAPGRCGAVRWRGASSAVPRSWPLSPREERSGASGRTGTSGLADLAPTTALRKLEGLSPRAHVPLPHPPVPRRLGSGRGGRGAESQTGPTFRASVHI